VAGEEEVDYQADPLLVCLRIRYEQSSKDAFGFSTTSYVLPFGVHEFGKSIRELINRSMPFALALGRIADEVVNSKAKLTTSGMTV
jgi:hypothetical protein